MDCKKKAYTSIEGMEVDILLAEEAIILRIVDCKVILLLSCCTFINCVDIKFYK